MGTSYYKVVDVTALWRALGDVRLDVRATCALRDDQGNSFLTPTPAAYLYRDWVVKALNDDMPYDEFVRLQIAGELLPDPASDYVTRLAGLGFQSLGPQFRKGAAAGEAKAKADNSRNRGSRRYVCRAES